MYRTLEEWESVSEQTRSPLMAEWDIYSGKGYWMDLFQQAVDELLELLKGEPQVKKVFTANHHGQLEVTVETTRGTPPLPGFDQHYRRMYRGLPVRQTWE